LHHFANHISFGVSVFAREKTDVLALEVFKREVKIHWISRCKFALWLLGEPVMFGHNEGERKQSETCLDPLTKRLYAGFYIPVALCILNRVQVVIMLIVFSELDLMIVKDSMAFQSQ